MYKLLCYKLLLVSSLIITSFPSFSTTEKWNNINTNETDSIFFLIYNLELSAAEKALIQSKNTLNPLIYNLLTTDLIWWKTLKSNNKTDFEKLEQYLNENQGKFEKLKQKNLLEELVNLNYQIRLMSINNQYFKMLKYYLRINSFIVSLDNTRLSDDEQNIFEIYKAIFNISKSKFVFTRGNLKNDNMIILKKQLKSSSLLNKTIACYFLAKIYSEIEELPEQSIAYYNMLCQLYPNNIIFKNELLSVQLKISTQNKK